MATVRVAELEAVLTADDSQFSSTMANADGTIKSTAQSIDNTGASFDSIQGKIDGVGTSADSLGMHFTTLDSSIQDASTSLNDVGSSVDDIDSRLSNVGDSAEHAGDGLGYAGDRADSARGGFDSLGKTVKSAGDDLDRTAALAGEAGENLQETGAAIAAIGAGISLAFGKMANDAIDFEKNMANVNSILKLTPDDLQKLSDDVAALSPVVNKGPIELSEALYDVASSGFVGAEGLMVVEAAANAANAGLTSTATAGSAISAVLNAYGLDASNAANTSDILFQTVNDGVVSFEELATNMGNTLPLASSLGIQFEELAAAYAQMTLQGVNASGAETQIAALMRSAINPTTAATEALANYSVEGKTFNTVQDLIADGGLPAYLQFLDTTAGGSKEELFKLIGTAEGMNAALLLGGPNAAAYTEEINKMGSASEGAGATQEALAKQSESTAFKLNMLGAATEAMNVAIGDSIKDAIAPAAEMMAKLFFAISDLPDPITRLIGILGAGSGALLSFGGGFLLAIPQIAKFKTGLEDLGIGMNSLKLGFGVAGVALVAFAALFLAYETNFLGFRDTVNAVIGGITSTVTEFVSNFQDAFATNIGAGLNGAAAAIAALGVAFDNTFGTNLFPIFAQLAQGVQDLEFGFNALKNRVAELTGKGFNPLQAATIALKEAFPAVGGAILAVGDILQNLLDTARGVADGLGQAFDALRNGDLGGVFQGILAASQAALGGLVENWRLIGTYLLQAFNAIDWAAIGATLYAGIQAASSALQTWFQEMSDNFMAWASSVNWAEVALNIVQGIGNALASIGDAAGQILSGLGDLAAAFSTWVQGALPGIQAAFGNLFSSLTSGGGEGGGAGSVVQNIIAGLGDLGAPLATWVTNAATALTPAWESIKSGVTGALSGMSDEATSVMSTITTTIQGAWSAISSGVAPAWAIVTAAISGAWANIQTTVGTAISTLQMNIGTAFQGFGPTVTTALETVKTAAATAWEAVKTDTGTKIEEIKTAVGTAFGGFGETITTGMEAAKTAASTAWETIKTDATTKVEEMKTEVMGKFDTLRTEVVNKVTDLQTTLGTIFDNLKADIPAKLEELATNGAEKFETLKTDALAKVEELSSTAQTTIQTLVDEAVAKFTTLATDAQAKVDEMKTTIVETVNALQTEALEIITNLGTEAVAQFETLKTDAVAKATELKDEFVRVLGEMKDDAVSKVGEIKDGIVAAFADAGTWLLQAGKDIVQGLIDGIASMKDAAVNQVTSTAGSIKDAATGFFRIGSPSKMFFEFGVWIIEGLMDGIEEEGGNAVDLMRRLGSDVVGSFSQGLERAKPEARAAAADFGDMIAETVQSRISGIFSIVGMDSGELRDSGKKAGQELKAGVDSEVGDPGDFKVGSPEWKADLEDRISSAMGDVGRKGGDKLKDEVDESLSNLDDVAHEIASLANIAGGDLYGVQEAFNNLNDSIKDAGYVSSESAQALNYMSLQLASIGGENTPEAIAELSVEFKELSDEVFAAGGHIDKDLKGRIEELSAKVPGALQEAGLAFGSFGSLAGENIGRAMGAILEQIRNLLQEMVKIFREAFGIAGEQGTDAFADACYPGLKDAISGGEQIIVEGAKDWNNSLVTIGEWAGQTVGEAFANGMTQKEADYLNSIGGIVDRVVKKGVEGGRKGGTIGQETVKSAKKGVDKEDPGYQRRMTDLVGKSIDSGKKEAANADEVGVETVDQMTEGLNSRSRDLFTAAGKTAAGVIKEFGDKVQEMYDVGVNYVEGFILGMQSMKSDLQDAANELGKEAEKELRKATESKSPSRAAYRVGQDVGRGFSTGIESGEEMTKKAARKLWKAALKELIAGQGAARFLGQDWAMNYWEGMLSSAGSLESGRRDFAAFLTQQLVNAATTALDKAKAQIKGLANQISITEDLLAGAEGSDMEPILAAELADLKNQYQAAQQNMTEVQITESNKRIAQFQKEMKNTKDPQDRAELKAQIELERQRIEIAGQIQDKLAQLQSTTDPGQIRNLNAEIEFLTAQLDALGQVDVGDMLQDIADRMMEAAQALADAADKLKGALGGGGGGGQRAKGGGDRGDRPGKTQDASDPSSGNVEQEFSKHAKSMDEAGAAAERNGPKVRQFGADGKKAGEDFGAGMSVVETETRRVLGTSKDEFIRGMDGAGREGGKKLGNSYAVAIGAETPTMTKVTTKSVESATLNGVKIGHDRGKEVVVEWTAGIEGEAAQKERTVTKTFDGVVTEGGKAATKAAKPAGQDASGEFIYWTADGVDKGSSKVKQSSKGLMDGAGTEAKRDAKRLGKIAGGELSDGIEQGIRAGGGKINQAATDVIKNAHQAARDAAKSKSPSELFADLGYDLDLGLIEGIRKGVPEIEREYAKMMSAAGDGATVRTSAAFSAQAAANKSGPTHYTLNFDRASFPNVSTPEQFMEELEVYLRQRDSAMSR